VTDLRLVASAQVPDAVKAVLEGTAGPFAPLPDSRRKPPGGRGAQARPRRRGARCRRRGAYLRVDGNPRAVVLSRSALVAAAIAPRPARRPAHGSARCAALRGGPHGARPRVRVGLPRRSSTSTSPASRPGAPDAPAYISLVPTQLYKALRSPMSAQHCAAKRCSSAARGGSRRASTVRRSPGSTSSPRTNERDLRGMVYDGVPLPRVHVGWTTTAHLAQRTTTFSGYRLTLRRQHSARGPRSHVDRGAWVGDRRDTRQDRRCQ